MLDGLVSSSDPQLLMLRLIDGVYAVCACGGGGD
jgi:hypothetical protein